MNTTKVNVRLHSYPSNYDLMLELIDTVAFISEADNYTVEEKVSIGSNEITFSIELEDQSKNKLFIDNMYHHKDNPYEGFIDIYPFDFTMSVESNTMDNLSEYVRTKSDQFSNKQFEFYDQIMNSLADDQAKSEERLRSIEAYLSKSGIVYYKQFIEALLEVLGDKGIVDEESLNKTMFPKVH